jgi:hypothetical protein
MATYTFDALVYGGTMFGINAAKRIADAGYSVAVLEWTPFTGGLVTGGLGLPDYVANTDWGLTRIFFQRVEQAAIAAGATSDTYGYHPNGLIRRYAPDWARTARDSFLSTSGITVVTDIEIVGVVKDAVTKQISSVTLSNGDVYRTSRSLAFLDASYEGDLLRLAGVPLDYGRNSVQSFNEYNAGYRPDHYASNPNQRRVNARGDTWPYYTMPPRSTVLGSADAKTQGYDFRMTLSTESNRRPFIPPPGFRIKDFLDWIDEVNVRGMSTIEAINSYQTITPGLHTTNGNDWHGRAWRYPRMLKKADRLREQAAYYYKHMGQFYVAMTDSRIPQNMRDNMAIHGLPATHNTNEFIGTPGWSSALYVRKCNSMRNEQVLTFADMVSPGRQSKTDPVSIGGYNADRHYVNYFATATGGFNAEGGLEDEGRSYYQIPFRACRPSPRHCTNLVTAWTLAGMDVFFSSFRMEPTAMVVGDAMGLAMVAALDNNIPVGLLDYGILRERLINANAVITY